MKRRLFSGCIILSICVTLAACEFTAQGEVEGDGTEGSGTGTVTWNDGDARFGSARWNQATWAD